MALKLDTSFIQSTVEAGVANISFRSNNSSTDQFELTSDFQGPVARMSAGQGFFANFTGPGGDMTRDPASQPPLGTVFRNPNNASTFFKVSGGAWTNGQRPNFLCGIRMQGNYGSYNGSLPHANIYQSTYGTIQLNFDDDRGVRYRLQGVEFMRQNSIGWIIGRSSFVFDTPVILLLQGPRTNNPGAPFIVPRPALSLQLTGFYPTTRNPVVTFWNNNNGTQSQQGRIEINDTSIQLVSSSDYRLKTDVQDITDARDLVMALRPCSYERTDILGRPRGTGFIAHELETVLPRAVIGQRDAVDADGRPIYQSIDTKKIIPLLAAGLKQIRQELTRLDLQIQAQKG